MPITTFLQDHDKHELEPFKAKKDKKDLRKSHVPFSGTAQKHPYEEERFILVPDPFNPSFYYEFTNADVEYAEELTSIVNLDGETIRMILVWIKKQSIGLRCTPFIVAESPAPGGS